jgi:N-acetylmuramoyl-L-alanine amidase
MSKLILVSAGHSTVPPVDPGAVGNGFVEAQEALRLRDATAKNLREKGESVIEDGADGVNEPLKKALVLARKADIAVEFHFNAGPPHAAGIEVLSKPSKKLLAQKIAGAINRATGLTLRGDKGWKADNSGHHHRLAFCEAGGLIVEVCFISNKSDMLAYKNNFAKIAENLAEVLSEA